MGIHCSIGFDQGDLAILAARALAVLHADDAVIASLMHVLEDVGVVDLAGSWLASTGVVANLEVWDVFPGVVHVIDQIALARLLVVEILENAA